MASSISKSELIRSSAASMGLRLAGLVAGFGLGVILARLLGPAEFGLYGLTITLSSLAASLAMLGTPQLAVREISMRRARQDAVGASHVATQFLRIVAMSAAALSLASLAGGLLAGARGTDLLLIGLGCLVMTTSALGAIAAAHLRAAGHLQQGQFFDTAGRPLLALAMVAALVLVSVPLNATLATAVQAGVGLFALVVSLMWVRQAFPSPVAGCRPAIPWLGAALPLCGVDFLAKLDGAYGLVLLGPLGSDVELGIYRVAVACVTLVGMPATVLHVVLAPHVAELIAQDNRPELANLLRRVSLLLLCCMVPGTIFLALFGGSLLTWTFGEAYAGAATPLLLLAVAQTVFAAFGMGPILLAMGGGERTLIRIYLVAVIAGAISAIPLILSFGASGAAAAQIVSLSLIGLQSWLYARDRWGVNLTCFGASTFAQLARS